MQKQLDEEITVSSSSSDDDADGDDGMPKLSPVAGISTASCVYQPSSVQASSTVTSTGSIPRPCYTGNKSVKSELSANNAKQTQLYCICRTPYDETKYVIVSSCQMTF